MKLLTNISLAARWRALLAVLSMLAVPAAAQPTMCVAPAYGVPTRSGAPDWWSPAGSASLDTRLQDPRWMGSARVDYNSSQASFLILEGMGDNHVYLSWRVNLTNSTENHVYLAWKRPAMGGNPASPVLVDIFLQGGPAVTAGWGGTDGSAQAYTLDAAGNRGATLALPGFVNSFTRVWRNAPSWAVQVRLPKSEIEPEADGAYKLWYEAVPGAPTGAQLASGYAWPRNQVITSYPNVPAVAQWGKFKPAITIYSPDPSCLTSGVALNWDNIGTTNSPSSLINRNANNTLFAKPINYGASAIPTGQILATFRLANWGSVVNAWNPIATDAPTSIQLPAGGAVPATNPVEVSWNPGGAPGLTQHQCMLVELRATSGVEFINSSIYRNMNFDTASVFKREAEISIKGLTPIAADGRDVYVWIEQRNMPGSGASQLPGQIRTMNPPKGPRVVEIPGKGEQGRVILPGVPTEGEPASFSSISDLEKLLSAGRIDQEIIEEVLPAYRVHVFHDSGQRWNVNGSEKVIMTPQTSFGVYLVHNGAVTGWQSELVPQGFNLEKLADNFYRIRKVPNDGVVKLVAQVTAAEPGGGATGWPWWVWLLLLLLILLLLIWILRRRKS